jgi:uncharacterized phage protein (predicted DNA packaging)
LNVNELKKYLRVDEDDDYDLIEDLQLAAEEYLTIAGISKNYEMKLYALAIKLLVAHWYDNRMIHSNKEQVKLSFGLDEIIMQLKLLYAPEPNG